MRPAPASRRYAAVRRLRAALASAGDSVSSGGSRCGGEHREKQLDLGREGVAVDLHRRLAREPDLQAGRQRAEYAALPTLRQLRRHGGAGHAAMLPPRARRRLSRNSPPSQLTAERENIRIEIAVSAAANSATTARLEPRLER